MEQTDMNQYIRSVKLEREKIPSFSDYPFCLAAVRNLFELKFHPMVTFIIGENGTGKSTILEAIATAYGINPEGGTKNFNFSSMDTHSKLHNYIRIVKGVKRQIDGFSLRAESFYNVATNINELDAEEMGPKIIDFYGGQSLHQQSHGESFLSLFINKFREKSICLIGDVRNMPIKYKNPVF